MVLTEDSGKNRPRVPADRTPTTEREITVQSDDQHILDILESRGDMLSVTLDGDLRACQRLGGCG